MDKDVHAAKWALERHENNPKSNLSPYQVRNIKKFVVSKGGKTWREHTPMTGTRASHKDKVGLKKQIAQECHTNI